MTTYVYETIPTSAAEKTEYFELKQSMRDAAYTQHPETGRPIRRVILGGIGVLTKAETPAPATKSGGCCCGPQGCCE